MVPLRLLTLYVASYIYIGIDAADDVADSTLLSAIVVSRHGVRTPYSPAGGDLAWDSLRSYSSAWKDIPISASDWGVPSMSDQHLTPHGARVISHMGEFYGGGERYGTLFTNAEGLNCDAMFFYANYYVRTQQTAESFLKGMAPSCSSTVRPAVLKKNSLFTQGEYQTPGCGPASRGEIEALLGGSAGGFKAWNDAWKFTVADIQAVAQCCPDKSLCGSNTAINCTIQDIPTTWAGHYWESLDGAAHIAKFFSDMFLLAAMNNMTFALGQRQLSQVVQWYDLNLAILENVNNQWSAKSYASMLAVHILASLEQASTGVHIPGLLHGPRAKFVYMAGHDMNLLLLKNLLGLTWLVDGWQRDHPVLGGMLVFELHRSAANAHSVRAFFEAATPSQIRNATRFQVGVSTPSRAPVAIPGCPALDCPLTTFRSIVFKAVKLECVHDNDLYKFIVEGAPGDFHPGASGHGLDISALCAAFTDHSSAKVVAVASISLALVFFIAAFVECRRCSPSIEVRAPLLAETS